MQTVWKYPLQLAEKQELHLPIGATPLRVMVQDGTPCLWCKVDTNQERELRIVKIHGTGHRVTANLAYIDSFMLHDGELVFHVFIVI